MRLRGREESRMRNKYVRWRVAVQTALVVLGIIVVKLVIAALSLEFIELSPLFTSVWPEACSCWA
jgi:hypothetical protein